MIFYLKLDSFQYATSLDLKMRYYHIQLSENTSNLCTIIISWVKYSYKHISMVIPNSPDTFKYKMNDLFHAFKFIRAYIDELLILTKVDCTNNVKKLELTLNKLKKKGLKR